MILDHNCYWETGGGLLARLGGKNYAPADFARYQAECAQDPHSVFAKPRFADVATSDNRYENPPESE